MYKMPPSKKTYLFCNAWVSDIIERRDNLNESIFQFIAMSVLYFKTPKLPCVFPWLGQQEIQEIVSVSESS